MYSNIIRVLKSKSLKSGLLIIIILALIQAILESLVIFILPNILKTFAEIGEDAKGAVKNLLIILEHDNPQYRALAAEALGEIGEPSKVVINSLESLKDDKDKNVIKTVQWSLNELRMIQNRRDNED